MKMQTLQSLNKLKISFKEKATFNEIHNGYLDSLNNEYYNEMEKIFHNTSYQIISDTYKKRDYEMYQNIQAIIDDHPNKTIVVVTGADHRFRLLQHLISNEKNEEVIFH